MRSFAERKATTTELQELRARYDEDRPEYACNQVIDEYWDDGPIERARAIEISHEYLAKTQQASGRPSPPFKRER